MSRGCARAIILHLILRSCVQLGLILRGDPLAAVSTRVKFPIPIKITRRPIIAAGLRVIVEQEEDDPKVYIHVYIYPPGT